MTDDEVQLFLSLKFPNIGQAVQAFKKAINAPEKVPVDNIMVLLSMWTEQGAPETFEVSEEIAERVLVLKYGSISNAYYNWVNLPPNAYSRLSINELRIVVDYVPVQE